MIIPGILALLATIGINYICRLTTGAAFSNSVLSALLFAGMFLLWKKTLEWMGIAESFDLRAGILHELCMKKQKPQTGMAENRKKFVRRILYAESVSCLFSLTMVMGYQIKVNGMTECGFRGKGMILVHAFCLSAAVFPVFYGLFTGLDRIPLRKQQDNEGMEKEGQKDKGSMNARKVFFFCWAVIFVCWIPVFLAYYPAVMAYDFHRQSMEASFGPPYFNSHHPLAHTLLIWVFFKIGGLLGSLEAGMACYSIFQMLLLSLALSYSCVMIYRLCGSKTAVAAATIFYGLFPYNSILSVSVTKDVIFAALFLIFFLLLVERVHFGERHNRNLLDLGIWLEGILMLLFRNNAIYALAVFFIFFVIFTGRKEKLRMLVLCVLIIVLGKASLEGLQYSLGGLGRGSNAEKYSVIMQQFARVGYYHKDDMAPETAALLDTYVSEEYWGNYNPPIADTVKIFVSATDFAGWEEDMPSMWRAWAQIGRQYPNEYLDAFLCLTNGYWFLDDVTWAENLGFGLEERLGALFTFNSTESDILPEGIAHESKFPWLESRLEEIVSNNCFYRWPVVSNLFKPAFYCWALVLGTIAFFYLKRKKDFMLTLLPLAYLGTLLLGPVVIVRYMMPILISVPVLAAMLFHRDVKD